MLRKNEPSGFSTRLQRRRDRDQPVEILRLRPPVLILAVGQIEVVGRRGDDDIDRGRRQAPPAPRCSRRNGAYAARSRTAVALTSPAAPPAGAPGQQHVAPPLRLHPPGRLRRLRAPAEKQVDPPLPLHRAAGVLRHHHPCHGLPVIGSVVSSHSGAPSGTDARIDRDRAARRQRRAERARRPVIRRQPMHLLEEHVGRVLVHHRPPLLGVCRAARRGSTASSPARPGSRPAPAAACRSPRICARSGRHR